MKYERLTKRTESLGFPYREKKLFDVIERLAELEDDLESGKLIRLPCKVGDTVYVLDTAEISDKTKISEAIVADYNISSYDYSILVYENKYSYYLWNCGLGFDWFTDKAEAEKKLKELQGE